MITERGQMNRQFLFQPPGAALKQERQKQEESLQQEAPACVACSVLRSHLSINFKNSQAIKIIHKAI